MYKSPIEIFYGQLETRLEGEVLKAIYKQDINIDKYELIRALQYDRDQYNKGYADGKRDAMTELVRCKECMHWVRSYEWQGCECRLFSNHFDMIGRMTEADDFCSYGERRNECT